MVTDVNDGNGLQDRRWRVFRRLNGYMLGVTKFNRYPDQRWQSMKYSVVKCGNGLVYCLGPISGKGFMSHCGASYEAVLHSRCKAIWHYCMCSVTQLYGPPRD